MTAQPTQEPTHDDIMHELKDIKEQLVKSNKGFNKSKWLTPLSVGVALVGAGAVALTLWGWAFIVIGAALAIYSFVKIQVISRRKDKER